MVDMEKGQMEYEMKSISTSYQFIHCEISHLDGGKSHSLIVVYAHYQLSQWGHLWVDIKNIAKNVYGMWMVIVLEFPKVKFIYTKNLKF